MFFRRPFRAKVKVLNDISQDIATLFRVLQRHYEALMDMLRWQLTSRSEFERLTAVRADTLPDLERAARFLYLQRTGFGGKVADRTFGVSLAHAAQFDVTKLRTILEAAHERLAGVVIERLPYADLIARYDRPDTLFYVDPPYWGNEADYGAGVFGRPDFQRLADLLRGIQGRFLLSLNDTSEVRQMFRGFNVEEEQVSYSIDAYTGARRPRGELIITAAKRTC